MKKTVSLIAVVLLLLAFTTSCNVGGTGSAVTTPAAPGTTTTEAVTTADPLLYATLRIEGNSACLYNGKLPFESGDTLGKAISDFDLKNDTLTFTGVEDDYITAVNNEASGSFGGWDGWQYTVNGVSPESGMSGITLSDGDEVLLYYGDPFGIGMEFPEYAVDGKTVTFTSGGKPVVGMTVTLTGKEIGVYLTDENGRITAEESGRLSVEIKKNAENGLTLVLRYPADEKITVG